MDRVLITNGAIVSMDPAIGDLRRGDVLIEDGLIVAVGPALAASDCAVIDAEDMVVMPGLVDSHRHLWYGPFRAATMDHTLPSMTKSLWGSVATKVSPEDLYVSTRAEIADALQNGITTVLDFCHVLNSPAHAPEAVRAHLELPMRAVFAYGASIGRKLAEMDGQAADTDGWGPARDLRAGVLASDDARVTMALAPQGPEGSTAEQVLSDIRFARELGLPITMHIGTPYDPQHPSQAIGVLAELDLLGPDMNLVHCCSSSDEQFRQLAAAGSTATVSPMAEVTLGMGYPPTGRMRTAGLTPAIGADAVCATSGDLFEEARHALFAERARCSEGLFSSGRAVIEPQEMGMSSRQALEAITIEGARACWLGDRIGSLTPGKAADVILLRGTDLNLTPMGDLVSSIVCCAQGPNVDTVLVGGQTVKRGGALVGIDVRAIESALRKSYERLVGGAAKASTVP